MGPNPHSTHRPDREVTAAQLELVDRSRAGDRDAFAQLYRHFLDPVTRYVAVRMRERDPHAVPDLVHDAFCDALADPTRLGPDVLGSLLQLAAKACVGYEWSRRRFVRAAYAVHADQQASPGPAGPDSMQNEPVGAVRFAHALARLDDDQRRVVQLRYLDGCTRAEAATAMGKTTDAVRYLEQRALQHLHADLTRPGTGPDSPAHTGEPHRHAPATA